MFEFGNIPSSFESSLRRWTVAKVFCKQSQHLTQSRTQSQRQIHSKSQCHTLICSFAFLFALLLLLLLFNLLFLRFALAALTHKTIVQQLVSAHSERLTGVDVAVHKLFTSRDV